MKRPSRKDATRAKLDGLIDFYEQFKPDAGRRIPIDATAAELMVILGKRDQQGVFEHRGRVVVPVGKS